MTRTPEASAWLLYILECRDGTWYTGITNDLERRLLKHAQGKGARYTRSRGPFKVIYQESFSSKPEALAREMRVKSLSRRQKEKLVQGLGTSPQCQGEV